MAIPFVSAILPALHLAVTLVMTGVIVFVQVAHYPLMAWVGDGGYRRLVRSNWIRTATWGARVPVSLALLLGLRIHEKGDPPPCDEDPPAHTLTHNQKRSIRVHCTLKRRTIPPGRNP